MTTLYIISSIAWFALIVAAWDTEHSYERLGRTIALIMVGAGIGIFAIKDPPLTVINSYLYVSTGVLAVIHWFWIPRYPIDKKAKIILLLTIIFGLLVSLDSLL